MSNIEIGAQVPLVDLPRDPDFLEKAGRVLDLHQGRWQGKLLEPGDFVICADAKPSIQARRRIRARRPLRVAASWSSTSTSGSAPSPISMPGTFATAS